MKGRGGKWIHFKMLLELPISEVFAGGRRRERRGKCRGRKGGRVVGKNSKEFSTNNYPNGRKGLQCWEVEGGGGGGGGGGWYQSYLLKGKGDGITQGRQGMC